MPLSIHRTYVRCLVFLLSLKRRRSQETLGVVLWITLKIVDEYISNNSYNYVHMIYIYTYILTYTYIWTCLLRVYMQRNSLIS